MSYAFDPELLPLVEMLAPGDFSDVAASRAGLAALIAPMNAGVDTSGLTVEDRDVPGPDGAPPVPVRVYAPAGAAPAAGRPALLDIHGGGFVVGDMEMEHGFAVAVARELDAVVVVVEYRLAPEHPFPAGIEDCYAALTWLHDGAADLGVDPARVAVGGQSAGGGLSAATALLARDRGGPPLCFQFLGIPELDHRLETTSMRTFVDTPMWHRANAELSWRYYLGPDPGEVSPYASPALASDLAGLPPAYVTAMEFDPLRDEGILYALRLMEAGVSVELHSYPGTFHGSAAVPTAAVSRRASQELIVALARGLGVSALMRRVHVVGAGPVGLLLAALLQPLEGVAVHLYEKRQEYTRTRMVQLAPRIAADTVARYREVAIDDVDYEAVFEVAELEDSIAFRREIPPDLAALIADWVVGFCPLNTIEQALSDLIDERTASRPADQVERTLTTLGADDALALLEPGDLMVDCTGTKSLLRDRLLPDAEQVDGLTNTHSMLFENALVVTFLYGQTYDCNEYCKYYKNVGTERYKFIPAVHRTFNDGAVTHVTGLITISPEDYAAMPSQFDGQWLREHFPGVADSVEHFVDKIKEESHGEIVGDLHIIRIPLNLYRARHATSRQVAAAPVILAGDSAIGSPYFQSISLGFECAMYLAGLVADRSLAVDDLLDRYETYCFKQWMRVYMRSKMIKHNKDLFELLDDKFALLDRLHLY